MPAHHRTLPAAHRHPEPPGETAATEPLNWLREQPCDSWVIRNLGSSSRGIQPIPAGSQGWRWGFTQSHRGLGRSLPACRDTGQRSGKRLHVSPGLDSLPGPLDSWRANMLKPTRDCYRCGMVIPDWSSSGERTTIAGNLAKSARLNVSKCFTLCRSIAATSQASCACFP